MVGSGSQHGVPWWDLDLGPGVRAGVTTRAGGVSEEPYASLDLAFHVGDAPAAVSTNRERVAARLGFPVVYANQVHGTHVVVVGAEGGSRADGSGGAAETVGDADGLVTAQPRVGLAVMVADCLPVLLADPERGVVGAAHAGRRGLVDGVVPAVVDAMTRLGARAERIRCFLGPAICAACYEVGAEVRDEVARSVPAAAATTRWGTPAVDLVAGVTAQLVAAGVADAASSGACTVEDLRFYSYRRDGRTGRFAGVIAMDGDDTPPPFESRVQSLV